MLLCRTELSSVELYCLTVLMARLAGIVAGCRSAFSHTKKGPTSLCSGAQYQQFVVFNIAATVDVGAANERAVRDPTRRRSQSIWDRILGRRLLETMMLKSSREESSSKKAWLSAEIVSMQVLTWLVQKRDRRWKKLIQSGHRNKTSIAE